MSNIITVSGVAGYIDENGTAQLSLEHCARGLGFTQSKNNVEYVRWETVHGYLSEMGFSQLVGKEFIPENIFYRLAMKAKNETAEKFQTLVADEILPAIRKTGSYSTKSMTQIEMLAAQAQAMVELERKTEIAVHAASAANQRIDKALDALAAPAESDWQTATGNRIKRIAQENQLSYVVLFGDLYGELEDTAHVDLQSRVARLQGRMKKAGATYKERQAITKLHVVALDPKLKLAFDGIVRRVDAKYTAARLPQ
ncbi:MAG TPA: BRO family protein [Anaerovoracaceae bacterium]|nr:BRO family protein [Anaerovoracaceae bacterium]